MIAGHLWTILPNLRHRVRPLTPPAARAWSTTLVDPKVGRVTLRGQLRDRPESDALCVVVHGLGGAIDSQYTIRAAQAVDAAGMSCLRLALRGACRTGEDYYHAALTADLDAAIASDALRRFRRIYVLGFSLGGHVTLRLGTRRAEPRDPRIRALASVCAPLDLHRSCAAIDDPRRRLYRAHVLSGLVEIYELVAARRPVPTPLEVVRGIRFIREWDRHVIVPRFGFRDENDYYDRASAGPRLSTLELPTLIVSTTGDPMVPEDAVRPSLVGLPAHVETRWIYGGGHVGYPRALDLGFGPDRGLEAQVLAWMRRH